MNVLDIIILSIAAYALFSGVRSGMVAQLCSLLGIFVGVYLAGEYCQDVAAMCGIKGEYSSAWGYAIVLLVSIIAVSVAARGLRQVLQFAGLGIVDSVLGAMLSLCKYLLIMSIIFTAFEMVNGLYGIMTPEELAQSRFFHAVASITDSFTPAWEWTQTQINNI